jgi:hypothetical protein
MAFRCLVAGLQAPGVKIVAASDQDDQRVFKRGSSKAADAHRIPKGSEGKSAAAHANEMEAAQTRHPDGFGRRRKNQSLAPSVEI